MIWRTPTSEADEYSYSLHMAGTGTCGQEEEQDEAVRLLHEAVAEVTGKPVEKQRRRIGFVWD